MEVFRSEPCCFLWSPILSIRVPDQKIKLKDFDLDYLSCIRQFSLDFEYSDNSSDQFAKWKLDFKKRKSGGKVARKRGSADDDDFGTVFKTFKKPRKLKVGRKYFAKLSLSDRARQTTKSRNKRTKIRSC